MAWTCPDSYSICACFLPSVNSSVHPSVNAHAPQRAQQGSNAPAVKPKHWVGPMALWWSTLWHILPLPFLRVVCIYSVWCVGPAPLSSVPMVCV
jgi:hypothetical protein